MTACILCKSDKTTITQVVDKADICALYARAFQMDISHLIKSDLLYHHCPDCDLRFFVCEDGSIPTGDNDFYNTLNSLDWYYFAQKHEYHYAKKFIHSESRVLEVGCGKAAFAHFLPQKAREQYVGLEFSTQAKQMAAKDGIYIENIAVEEYAKTHAQSFDVTCSFQVLEHVSNPHDFLQAQIECLKSGILTGGGAE